MSGRGAIRLTAERELREGLRSRAFRASVAVQVGIVLLVVVISSLTADDGAETFKVGITPDAPVSAEQLEQAAPEGATTIEITELADDGAARAALDDDSIDAALLAGAVLADPSTEQELIALLQSAAARAAGVDALAEAGLDDRRIAAALDPPPLQVEEVAADQGTAQGIAFAGVLLLYIALIGSGYTVTTGVVEEKASRVVELILASIRPTQLLAGKVLGIGLLGLGQMLLTATVGVGAALISGQIDLPSTTAATVGLVLVYFVLGYALYACAFAAAGAIVSRQEDVGSVTTPVMIVLVAGYIASISVIDDPGGTLATVCTLLPLTAPLVVPGRAALDQLPAWELAASIALMLIAIAILIWVAGRIYERAVLRVGAPMKLLEGLRLARLGR